MKTIVCKHRNIWKLEAERAGYSIFNAGGDQDCAYTRSGLTRGAFSDELKRAWLDLPNANAADALKRGFCHEDRKAS